MRTHKICWPTAPVPGISSVLGILLLGISYLGVGALSAAPATAQTVFETDEFQINVGEEGRIRHPATAFHRTGRFVTVWEDTVRGLTARLFQRNRTPASGDLVLVPNTPIGELPFHGLVHVQENPVLVMQDDRFLLFWTRRTDDISVDVFFVSRLTVDRTVFGRVFDLEGQPLGPAFQVSQISDARDSEPAAAKDAEGNVIVVWQRDDFEQLRVLARRYSPTGVPLTGERRVDDALNGSEAGRPSVASLASGESLVVWEACCDDDDPEGLGIFGRILDPVTGDLSDVMQINSTTEGNQRVPVVVGDDDGRFLVAWQGPTGEVDDGDRPIFRIYARRLHLDDGPLGRDAIVSGNSDRAHSSPELALGLDGDVVLTWMSWVQNFRVGVDGARLHLSDGGLEPTAEPFRISQGRIGGQFRLGLTSTPLGRFLVAWEGFGPDGLRIAARLVLPGERSDCSEGGGMRAQGPGSQPCAP